MDTHQELVVASENMDAAGLVRMLCAFAADSKDYVYLDEHSPDREKAENAPACVIRWMDMRQYRYLGDFCPAYSARDGCAGLKPAGAYTLAFRQTDDHRSLCLGNVGPLVMGEFAHDLTYWCAIRGNDISVLAPNIEGLDNPILWREVGDYVHIGQYAKCAQSVMGKNVGNVLAEGEHILLELNQSVERALMAVNPKFMGGNHGTWSTPVHYTDKRVIWESAGVGLGEYKSYEFFPYRIIDWIRIYPQDDLFPVSAFVNRLRGRMKLNAHAAYDQEFTIICDGREQLAKTVRVLRERLPNVPIKKRWSNG